jgi:hypothetical protein
MKKIALIIFVLNYMLLNQLMAQSLGGFMRGLAGEPIVATQYSKVKEGSPFLYEDWQKGIIILGDGQSYENLPLKLNLLEGTVHYKTDDNQEFVPDAAVKEVILINVENQKKLQFIHSSFICKEEKRGWYQVLDSGQAWLFRLDSRILSEVKPYGSAVIEEHITNSGIFVLKFDNQCYKLKNTQELRNKLILLKPESKDKLPKNGNSRSEEEMSSYMKYFNALF